MLRLFLLIGCSLRAQAQAPAFEVADVKPNKSGETRMAIDMQPGGKLIMRNVPMKVMIVFAYHVRPEALSGPAWMDDERYDVVAKAETKSDDEVRQMMQALLVERFKLATHTERKLMPAYALTSGKSGSKLRPSNPSEDMQCTRAAGQPGQRRVECRHVTTAFLADYLQELAPRDFTVPVVDQTGIAGAVDFALEWAPWGSGDDTGPDIFAAVETQLGLKLESRKLPLPVIVVDRVERAPVGN